MSWYGDKWGGGSRSDREKTKMNNVSDPTDVTAVGDRKAYHTPKMINLGDVQVLVMANPGCNGGDASGNQDESNS